MHYRLITYEVTLISSDHYKNSYMAMGQIPRSTEHISSSEDFVANFLENTTVKNCENRPAFAKVMNMYRVGQKKPDHF